MPFVHIRALPQPKEVNIPEILNRICIELGKVIDLPSDETCATWETVQFFAHGESVLETQQSESHPLLVDLLAFEGRSPEKIDRMIECVALVVAEGSQISIKNVFVNYREANWNRVFAEGEVVKRT